MIYSDFLVNIAKGDAYCLPCEFVDHPNFDYIYNLKRYESHPKYKTIPGTYTDDTQLSLAVSEAMLSGRDLEDPRVWASYFLDTFKQNPINGYARGFQKFLEETNDAREFIKNIKPDSDKNGAAMRSVPLGFLKLHDLLKYTPIQAAVTHNTPGGIVSSTLVALMSHYAIYNEGSMKDLNNFLYRTCNFEYTCLGYDDFDYLWNGRVAGPKLGMKTAHAVNTILRTETTFYGAIQRILKWGGDTDSVAAIALGIASFRMRDDLPAFFEDDLENGKYGRDYLRLIGWKMVDKYYPKKNSYFTNREFYGG